MKLYVKNMVCDRCKTIVKNELNKLDIQFLTVGLGEINMIKKITASQHALLFNALKFYGFELIDQTKIDLVEKLIKAIVDIEDYSDENLKTNFADSLSLKVNYNFMFLDRLFSEIIGTTIEKYIIKHKIEKVKKLLIQKDLKLIEIAHKMHYTNSAELSSQFKKVTGLTPRNYRQHRYSLASNLKVN